MEFREDSICLISHVQIHIFQLIIEDWFEAPNKTNSVLSWNITVGFFWRARVLLFIMPKKYAPLFRIYVTLLSHKVLDSHMNTRVPPLIDRVRKINKKRHFTSHSLLFVIHGILITWMQQQYYIRNSRLHILKRSDTVRECNLSYHLSPRCNVMIENVSNTWYKQNDYKWFVKVEL